MYRLLIFTAALNFLFTGSYSQTCSSCVIDFTGCVGGGIGEVCNDSIEPVTPGNNYFDDITFRVPAAFTIRSTDTIPGTGETFGSVLGGALSAFLPFQTTIEQGQLNDVIGLPTGLIWECDSLGTNCTYTPPNSQSGCVSVCGTPECVAPGVYNVRLAFTFDINIQSFINSLPGGVGALIPPGLIPSTAPNQDTFSVTVRVLPLNSGQTLAITSSSGATTITEGQTITLNASSDFSAFDWSDGSSMSSITVSPATTTTYTVTAEDSLGCPQTASVTITVLPDTASGLQEIINNIAIHVHPNPIHDRATLEISGMPVEQAEMLVYDLAGKTVHTETLRFTNGKIKHSLNFESPMKGIYLLNVKSDGLNVLHKIIVQ